MASANAAGVWIVEGNPCRAIDGVEGVVVGGGVKLDGVKPVAAMGEAFVLGERIEGSTEVERIGRGERISEDEGMTTEGLVGDVGSTTKSTLLGSVE